jgi:nucleotide-binding universal stress UspA family protein
MTSPAKSPTVVVGIDGSPCSQIALRWTAEYADATGASLKLVTAWHWPMSYGVPLAYAGFDPEEDARKLVEAAASDLGLPSDRVETVVAQGPSGDVLVEAAKASQLLVVGSRGHGVLAGTLIGSTSSYCIHHSQCPVVVAR